MWSFRMSYADLVYVLRQHEEQKIPFSLYHVNCLEHSLKNDMLTKAVYKRYSPASSKQKKELNALLASEILDENDVRFRKNLSFGAR